ncbi:T9SS type A sorting domain-containing protein [Leeuwenhoekiella nanhaiensis]|uniref:Secretion system C-terminal sorting domain-containing protein n=1 Tax=Leeuwenhoekiella nanhaiensis TaxID=1655491 RepID=A0A2G1VPK4_9FLAO|nr:T9SS type A sorting domain-containing protein [Leeuwenhoekiella nanhaiensis]PHQ28698.1 hypothetical protein CJ305_12820 [Leeuwenhoekiella nanhaiensis]
MKFTWFYIFLLGFAFTISAQKTHVIDWRSGSRDLSATLEVKVGDTVQWVFGEYLPQNIVNTSFGAPSDFGITQRLAKGSVYEYVFNKKGIYTFESSAKKSLKGSIKVSDSKSVVSQTADGYKIYPNPVKDRLFFESPSLSNSLDITFYDVLGKKVKQDKVSSALASSGLDVSTLKRGVYLIQIDNGSRSFTQKLIKD